MTMEEIDRLLSVYDDNPEKVKEYLLKCKRKLSDNLIQKTFEKYITNTSPYNSNDCCAYGDYNGKFAFTNGVSFYQLNNPLIISKFILLRNTRGKYNQSRKISSEDFDDIFNKVRDSFGETVLDDSCLVQYHSDLGAEKELTMIENNTGKLFAVFNSIELRNLDIFLGEGKVYLSKKTPMIYSETEYGKVYIFSRKID